MNKIIFGSESEHVCFEIPSSIINEGGGRITVGIRVNCFAGSINPWIDFSDIKRFSVELRKVFETLAGKTEFVPLEEQIKLKVETVTGGRIIVSGSAISDGNRENLLEFHMEMDQTYLKIPIETLEVICRNKEN
ncbi:hypothetical protein KKF34_12275 [Myxococcota bacterium]|nr:hypothetical protein [Myxococcota bacterium]